MLKKVCRCIHPQFAFGLLVGSCLSYVVLHQMFHRHVDTVMNQHVIMRQQMSLKGGGRQQIKREESLPLMFGEDAAVRESSPVREGPSGADYQTFDNAQVHDDNDTVARILYKQASVLCWIMTSPKYLYKRAIAVKDTWARRCNVVLFMSSQEDKTFPAIGLDVPEGRSHLTAKTMKALSFIYDNHFEDADWFLKADDDTYVVMENLRYLLSNEDPNQPVYFGQRFQYPKRPKTKYASGGAGYVLSKAALQRYGEQGRHRPDVCQVDGGPEDTVLGECMKNLRVELKSSLDSLGRSRFHCLSPESFVNKISLDWYSRYTMEDVFGGIQNMSDYTISFHYIQPNSMKTMEFLIYHLRPYGILNKLQDVNGKTKKTNV